MLTKLVTFQKNSTASSGYLPVSPEKHILTYFWFVGHQSASYRDVADRFGVTLSTLFVIITRITEFLLQLVFVAIVRIPSVQARNITKEHYLREKKFPGIIGKYFLWAGSIDPNR